MLCSSTLPYLYSNNSIYLERPLTLSSSLTLNALLTYFSRTSLWSLLIYLLLLLLPQSMAQVLTLLRGFTPVEAEDAFLFFF
jgi:hypothetical protein